MHLDQAAREALLQSHAIGVAYCKLCGFIALKLNTFIKAWSGAMMAFGQWVGMAVTFVVVGPLAEEVVFRHILQRGFQRLINRAILGRCSEASSDEQADKAASRRGAATTTTHFLVSLAFALIHVLGPIGDVMVGGQSRSPPAILRQFVYTGLASFFLYCPLFTQHGLPASVAAHTFWNALGPLAVMLAAACQALALACGQRLSKL